MKELKRPEIINVENFFNEFVEYYGGQIIAKHELNLVDRPNADYLFKKENVIAELKCFQKDIFNTEEDIPKIFDLLDQWEKRKLIKEGDKIKVILGTKKLPIECKKDLLNAYLKTIDRIIHKANKQIQASKQTFSIPKAKGLVLLCNDGNYFVQNDIFIGLILNVMIRKYMKSDIDGLVYFTLNQVSTIPNNNLDRTLWAPFYRVENDKQLGNFVNKLGNKFLNDFYTIKTGIKPTDFTQTDDLAEGIDIIKSMKYIPKNFIYKKK